MTANVIDWPLPEIDRLLRENVAELVTDLRGIKPNKSGAGANEVRFGAKGGLAVVVAGADRGRITDFEAGTGKGQSPLQFIQAEKNLTFPQAVQWAKEWLGIEGNRPAPVVSPQELRKRKEKEEKEKAEAERKAEKDRAVVARIASESHDIAGTPAESYLRGRSITAAPPSAVVRWQPNAAGRYGALVLLLTDADGTVQATQRVYVTDDGEKAPVKVQKRSNGRQEGATVRLPGKGPIHLIEGPETGLSVWQSSGCETWISVGGIGRMVDQVPAGSEVVVGRDADPVGSGADKAVPNIIDRLMARGCRVRLACPLRYPDLKKTDFNDVLQREGEAAVRALLAIAELHGACDPHFPSMALPTGQAQELLNRTLKGLVGHIATFKEGDTARQVGAKAAAGTGKSSGLRRALEDDPDIAKKNVYAFVPAHRLGDAVAADLADGPLNVNVIKGRSQEGMCAKSAEAEIVAKAGFNVVETMCRRVNPETGEEEKCEFHDGCRHAMQFNDPGPAVWIMAQESIFLPRSSEMPAPDAIVIDEKFFDKGLRHSEFPLDLLNAGLYRSFGRKVDMDDAIQRDTIARKVRQALEDDKHPRDLGVTVEDCQFCARLEYGAFTNIDITPGMPHAEQREKLAGFKRGPSHKLYRFWKTLEGEIERAGPLQRIELRRKKEGEEDGEKERIDRVAVHWRRQLELPDVPTLVIDADLDPSINSKFLPRLETTDIPVERKAHVIQVRDTACSRLKLLAWDGAPDDQVSRASNRLADIQALFNVEAASGARVLLVTYKAAAERLIAPPGCAVDYFGNLLGIDDYKDFDTIIVAGRQEISVGAAEAMARALFYDDAEPLNLTGAMVKETRAYRMRDGSRETVDVWVHPDPRVQALIEQTRERGSAQAIDRLRLIWRAMLARVIVLSNVPLDITVDQLTTWKEIMPTRFEQAAARGPAVPLSPSELARCFPDLWVSAKAAEREQERFNTPKPYRNLIYRKRGYLIAEYRRHGQRGKASKAAIQADAPDPEAALVSVVGPIVWFEIITPAETTAKPADIRLEAQAAIMPAVELGRPVLVVSNTIDPPPPAEDLRRLHAILSQGSRLADLSSRLDRFKPPIPVPIPERRVALS